MNAIPKTTSSRQPTNSERAVMALQARMNHQVQISAFSTDRARFLLGQFRRGEANDAVTFVSSVAAVLTRYPEDVVMHATDPRTGLAAKGDWLPTIHEIVTECDRLVAEQAGAKRRRDEIETQLAERRRLDALAAQDDKAAVAEAFEKFNAGTSTAPAKFAPRGRHVANLGAVAGMTAAEVEAALARIPDAPIGPWQKASPL